MPNNALIFTHSYKYTEIASTFCAIDNSSQHILAFLCARVYVCKYSNEAHRVQIKFSSYLESHVDKEHLVHAIK